MLASDSLSKGVAGVGAALLAAPADLEDVTRLGSVGRVYSCSPYRTGKSKRGRST